MVLQKEDLEFWDRVQTHARDEFKLSLYEYMIEPAKLLSVDDITVKIIVSTRLHKPIWTSEKMTDVLTVSCLEIYGQPMNYLFYSADEISEQDIRALDQTDSINEVADSIEKTNLPPIITGLSTKFSFETFVQGPGNKMALAAAIAVVDMPGDTYNPLFIYGGSGLGKTHLMHAIGNEMLKKSPAARIKYVSSEKFVNDYVDATRNHQFEKFELTYRTLDLLLVDDIQFISDKEGTKNEFFATFNALTEKGAQIVLTSDRLPEELDNLEDRLVTRFKWGLTTDITPYDYETRMAILMNKSEESELEFPADTLRYIASEIDSNVRELEGALKSVELAARISGITVVGIDTASTALRSLKKNHVGQTLANVTVKQVQEEVAKYYRISYADMVSTRRTKEIAFPRQVAMFLVRNELKESLPSIARAFNKKDHTTVMYAYDQIDDKKTSDMDLQKALDTIKQRLKLI